MIIEPTTAIVGTIAFGLHLAGKYTEDPIKSPFFHWSGKHLDYILTSLAMCGLGLIMRDEIMEPLGFTKPLTYAFVLCYGAGHLVSRLLGIAEAAKSRKA